MCLGIITRGFFLYPSPVCFLPILPLLKQTAGPRLVGWSLLEHSVVIPCSYTRAIPTHVAENTPMPCTGSAETGIIARRKSLQMEGPPSSSRGPENTLTPVIQRQPTFLNCGLLWRKKLISRSVNILWTFPRQCSNAILSNAGMQNHLCLFYRNWSFVDFSRFQLFILFSLW